MALSTPLGFTVTVKYRAKRSYRFPNDLANRVAPRWRKSAPGRGRSYAYMRIRQYAAAAALNFRLREFKRGSSLELPRTGNAALFF